MDNRKGGNRGWEKGQSSGSLSVDDLEELLEWELNESQEDSALGPGTSASSPPQPIKPKMVITHATVMGRFENVGCGVPTKGGVWFSTEGDKI